MSVVNDRRQFWEQQISQQNQSEKSVLSSTPSAHTSQTAGFWTMEDSSGFLFFEERTDSDSLLDGTDDKMDEREMFEPFLSRSDSESDTDPAELLQLESLYYSSKNYKENKLNNTVHILEKSMNVAPLQHQGPTSTRNSFKEKTARLDRKITSRLIIENENLETRERDGVLMTTDPFVVKYDNFEGKQQEGSSMWSPQKKIVGSQYNLHPSSYFEDVSSFGGSGRKSNQNVKIQVLNSCKENLLSVLLPTTEKTAMKSVESEDIADNIVSDKSSTISSPLSITETNPDPIGNHLLSKDFSRDHSREDSIPQYDSLLSLNNLSVDDFNGVTERHDVPLSKDVFISNNCDSQSESTDCSIDSKQNTKAIQLISSRRKSKKHSTKIRLKWKMVKMIKKAKERMGSSVKKVKGISFRKEKIKATPSDMGQKSEVQQTIPDENLIIFFDENLVEKIMSDYRHEAGFERAVMYLDNGKELLNHAANLEINKKERRKELIRIAHTHAYISRQLVRTSLLSLKKENANNLESAGDGDNITSEKDSEDEDSDTSLYELLIFPFEDLVPSFLQCSCEGSTVDDTQSQLEETLDILTKISLEEEAAIKSILSSKNSSKAAESNIQHNKTKVQVMIQNSLIDTANDPDKMQANKARNSSVGGVMDIRRFVSSLQFFYEADTTLNISGVFSGVNRNERQANIRHEEDQDEQLLNAKSDSKHVNVEDEARDKEQFEQYTGSETDMIVEVLSYDYSTSLKFDEGSSYYSDLETELDSLGEDVYPGTTVISIPVKTKIPKK